MELKIVNLDNKCGIFLDGVELKKVTEVLVKKSPTSDNVELMLKMDIDDCEIQYKS